MAAVSARSCAGVPQSLQGRRPPFGASGRATPLLWNAETEHETYRVISWSHHAQTAPFSPTSSWVPTRSSSSRSCQRSSQASPRRWVLECVLRPRQLPQAQRVERSAEVAVSELWEVWEVSEVWEVWARSVGGGGRRDVSIGVTSLVEVQVPAGVDVLVQQQVGSGRTTLELGHEHEVGDVDEAVAGIGRDRAGDTFQRGPPAGIDGLVVRGGTRTRARETSPRSSVCGRGSGERQIGDPGVVRL